MENPFEVIARRLSTVEELLLDIKHRPTHAAAPVDDVLSIEQAAELLTLTTQTLYGLVSARKIPFSKPTGSRLYFLRSELIEWLKSNRTATVGEQAQQFEQQRATRRKSATSKPVKVA